MKRFKIEIKDKFFSLKNKKSLKSALNLGALFCFKKEIG
jgi:hypothetical protein